MINRRKFLLLAAFATISVGMAAAIYSRAFADGQAVLRIDTSKGALGDIRVGMSEDDLLSLGYPVSRRVINAEGDDYPVIDVQLENDVVVECLIVDKKVNRFSVNSSKVRDENGVGMGIKLAELGIIYPKGKYIVGSEDVQYANFLNGSRVVFELDQSVIGSDCFDVEKDPCELDPETTVVKVVVHNGPAGMDH